jgi:hypothetical protein
MKGEVMALREELDEVLAGLERILEWRVEMLVKLDGLEARLNSQVSADTPSASRQRRREGLDEIVVAWSDELAKHLIARVEPQASRSTSPSPEMIQARVKQLGEGVVRIADSFMKQVEKK